MEMFRTTRLGLDIGKAGNQKLSQPNLTRTVPTSNNIQYFGIYISVWNILHSDFAIEWPSGSVDRISSGRESRAYGTAED
jgi:hypothetical protein